MVHEKVVINVDSFVDVSDKVASVMMPLGRMTLFKRY